MNLDRYGTRLPITTVRDPLQELLIHLGYLNSADHIVGLLVSKHSVSLGDAKALVAHVRAHAGLASSFAEQAVSAKDEAGLLPAYYAILNFLKLYILFSTRHADLPSNRWHGASYDVYAKDSRSLLTEVVTLRSGGALPLVYEVLTGTRYQDRTEVQLRDIYPYIQNVCTQWEWAGQTRRLATLISEVIRDGGDREPRVRVLFTTPRTAISRNMLRVFEKYRPVPGLPGTFRGPRVSDRAMTDDSVVRNGLRTSLLYSDHDGNPCTPVCGRSLLLPEELPIAIAFFHLSCVVRYKPEFLAKLRDSVYAPVIAALRYHGLLRATLLLLSYVQQRTLFVGQRPLGGPP